MRPEEDLNHIRPGLLLYCWPIKMLDVFDFVPDKGGDLEKARESQRRRYAPKEAVDEVIALYEDYRKSERFLTL